MRRLPRLGAAVSLLSSGLLIALLDVLSHRLAGAFSLAGPLLCAAAGLYLGGRHARFGVGAKAAAIRQDGPAATLEDLQSSCDRDARGLAAALAGPPEVDLCAAGDERDAESRGVAGGLVVPFPERSDAVSNVERAAGDLAAYGAFTGFLTKQMQEVTALSESAAGSIVVNLTAFDKQITALLGFIQQSGSNDKVGRVVSQIEGQLQGCRQMLDRFAGRQTEDSRHTRDQLAIIKADSAGVLNVLHGVSDIARQTMMLSVNVSIEAARAGEAGRGFSIIGSEIRNLASRVQDLSKEVHERIESLMRTVTIDLEQQATQRDREQQEAVANITDTLRTLADNLMTVITYNREVMQKVEAESESMGAPIMDIMGRIQFQDIIRQQLEQLSRMAVLVDEHLQSLAGSLVDRRVDDGEPTLAEKLEAEFGRYVMASQRRSHLEARGRAAAPAATSLIELF